MNISGTFEVALSPLTAAHQGRDGINLGRMSIDKTFNGELSATSKGEMLNAMTPVQGSAGYVAIEQVTGNLCGKSGTFVLQHYGMMSPKSRELTLEVVPDSGTGELNGLSGSMDIRIEEGIHYYDFEFEFV